MGLILSFYLLLLATIPCCVVDNCLYEKIGQASSHESGEKDCGTCSPLFSCEGCAATIAWETVQFELDPVRQKPVYAFYLQSILPKAEYEFWQPPKLG